MFAGSTGSTEVSAISPISLRKLVNHYIPSSMIPTDWACADVNPLKNIEELLERSNGTLKMYGTAQELLDRLNTFATFPGYNVCFDFIQTEAYCTSVVFYKSMKKGNFIYKDFLFTVIQHMIKDCPLRSFEAEICMATVHAYLKTFQSTISVGCLSEMTPIRMSTINSFAVGITIFNQHFSKVEVNSKEKFPLNFKDYTIDELLQNWYRIFPFFKKNHHLHQVLEQFFEKCLPKDNMRSYERIFTWCSIVIREIENFICKNEALFMPRSVIRDEKMTPIVRMFSKDSKKFVMAHELLQSMKREQMNTVGFEQKIMEMPRLSTLSFREIALMVSNEDLRAIEFVIVPINTVKFNPTPIPKIDGGYCALAIDILFDILRNMITIKKLFQRLEASKFNIIEKYFGLNEEFFDSKRGVYFIDLRNTLREQLDRLLDDINPSKVIKEVREVNGKDGFTSHDLKSELKYLELNSMFPEILEQADVVYTEYVKIMNRGVLKTTDMHCLLEILQVICILKRLPKLSEFVHNQGGCSGILNFQCSMCKRVTCKDDTGKEPKNSTFSEDSKSGNDLETTSRSSEKPESPSDKSKSSPVLSQKELVSRDQFTGKKPESKKKNNKEQPISVKKPEEKQSNACPKCFRGSVFNRKLREDLRLQKIENKQLKKNLKLSDEIQQKMEEKEKEMNLEIMEKNERIRVLEEQLLALRERRNEEIDNSPSCSSPMESILEVHQDSDQERDSEELSVIPEEADFRDDRGNRSDIVQEDFSFENNQNSTINEENENRWKTGGGSASKERRDSDELEDNQCLICHDNMESTEDTLKCTGCKRRYHDDCANMWFQIKRSCPTCDASMLNDEEFPPLSGK